MFNSLIKRSIKHITSQPSRNLFLRGSQFRNYAIERDDQKFKSLTLTVTGPNRIGMIFRIAQKLVQHQANIYESTMTTVNGNFGVMLHIKVPRSEELNLVQDIHSTWKDLQITLQESLEPLQLDPSKGYRQRIIKLRGSDRIGIIYALSKYFTVNEINVDDLRTYISPAPFSGSKLFNVEAIISVPREVAKRLESDISELGEQLGVDMWVEKFYEK